MTRENTLAERLVVGVPWVRDLLQDMERLRGLQECAELKQQLRLPVACPPSPRCAHRMSDRQTA